MYTAAAIAAAFAQAAVFLEARRATIPAGMVMRMAGVQGMAERAQAELDQVLARIDAVSAAALEQNRDLSDQDTETIKLGRERAEFLRSQLESLAVDVTLSDRAQAALRSNANRPNNSPTAFRSAGEALHVLLAAGRGDRDARQRVDVEMNRAAQHLVADTTNAPAVAGGLGALVVKPIVGPIIQPTAQGRPFLTAIGVQSLETPLGFSRPRLVDPNGAEAPAPQGGEKRELVSRTFSIKLDNVDSETLGEYLNISQQLLSLPIDALNKALNVMTTRRANATERRAVAEVLATPSTVALAADATAGDVFDAVWDAALQVFQRTGDLPKWILTGPVGWRRLGGLRDAAERPLFPNIGAANAMGSMSADTFVAQGPAGLPVIVSPAITDGRMVVGNDQALEAYEFAYPLLESIEASVLGRQVAVASEFALYRPTVSGVYGAGPEAQNAAVVIAPAAG